MTYDIPTNSTIGLSGLLTYINTSLQGVHGYWGANFLSFFIMIPVWLIIFLPLSRYNALAAFTTTSFIMTMASYFLMTIGVASTLSFGLFAALTAIGAAAFFLRVGQ